MQNVLAGLLIIAFFNACNPGVNQKQQDLELELSKMETKVDLDIQGFDWQGENLDRESLHMLNFLLNDKSINPSLTSTCEPPRQGVNTVRYQEHYRCGSLTALTGDCELWSETIPIYKGHEHVSKISDLETKLIFHRALNYGNQDPPRCTCQKRPSVPIRYLVQGTSVKDETNQTLTKKIIVMTTYNCCGPC